MADNNASHRYSQVNFVRDVPLGLSMSNSFRFLPTSPPSPSTSAREGFNRRAGFAGKRSESLPSFPRPMLDSPRKDARASIAELPANPKLWTATQLGTFLAHILKLLAPRIREDLLTLVRKHGLTGRKFLRMNELDYREKLNLNPLWTRLFLEARSALRRECLKARILGEADFEEMPSFLDIPVHSQEGRNSWKRSWRRSHGAKSKGRVKGMAHLFESSESSQTSTDTCATTRSRSQSLDSSYSSGISTAPAAPALEMDNDTDGDDLLTDEEIELNWSNLEPLDVTAFAQTSDKTEVAAENEGLGLILDNRYLLAEPRTSPVKDLVQVPAAKQDAHGTIKSTPCSLRNSNQDPPIHVTDIFSAAEAASEGLEELTSVKSRDGSCVIVKKSQLKELEKRMKQMEEMLESIQMENEEKEEKERLQAIEKRKQVKQALEDDNLTLTNLGGYMLMTALGVGIVAVEIVVSKVRTPSACPTDLAEHFQQLLRK